MSPGKTKQDNRCTTPRRTQRRIASKGLPAVAALLIASALSSFVVVALPGVAAASSPPTWTVQQKSSYRAWFNSVSCPTSSSCFAVGRTVEGLSSDGPLLYQTTNGGTTWVNDTASLPPGIHRLYDVSCVSASFCEAVGDGVTDRVGNSYYEYGVALSWDGTSWTSQTLPPSTFGLQSVSCVSTSFCEAVSVESALSWDGTNWVNQGYFSASTDAILSVSCVSASFCEAVGFDSALSWRGTSWTSQTLPSAGVDLLYGVSCVSASFCEAVGLNNDYTYGGALSWDGTSWTSQTFPSGVGGLYGVSCVSASFCEAVGINSNVGGTAVSWNGTSWTSQAPTPGTAGGLLYDVSCVSADFCDAVSDTVILSTAPAVTSITPTSGPAAGGTSVTITGTNFTPSTAVHFGNVAATAVTVSGTTSITATSPAEPAGTVNVTVTTPAGPSSTSTADEFTYTVPATGAAYTPVDPMRLADTRCSPSPAWYCASENLPAANASLGTLSPGGSENVVVAGVDGIPKASSAVVVNVTAVDMTGGGYLSVYPEGSAPAVVSNLNWTPATKVATNLVTVPVNTSNGEITVTNGSKTGNTDYIVDMEGYYSPPGSTPAGLYNAVTPTRLADSRCGRLPLPAGITGSYCSNLPGANANLIALGAGDDENVTVAGVGPIPVSGVSAVALNITAVGTSTNGFLTAYPAGTTRATVSSLDWTAGETVPNRVVVKVGTNGAVTLYNNSGTTNFIVDVTGYYTDGSSTGEAGSLFNPLTPARILDTRCSVSSPPAYCSTEHLPGVNASLAAVSTGQSITVQVAGIDDIPASATGFVGNLTATGATGGGYLTVYPSGTPPVTSDVNFAPGTTDANMVIGELAPSGTVDIADGGVNGGVNVVLDVSGWFTQPTS